MSQYSDGQRRDNRVILAWIVLALQIIGLLWLLLFARDRLAAWTGGDADRGTETVVPAEASSDPAATAVAESTAAPTDVPAEAPETDATGEAGAMVIRPEDVSVDASAVAPDWFVTLVEEASAGAGAERPDIPPHLLLTFADPNSPEAGAAEAGTVEPGTVDLNKPQLRIIPVATLLDMLRARDDEAGRQALEDLLSLLEQRPDIETAAIPVPPVLGEVDQNFVSRAAFKSFGGGTGVGYVTNITGEDVSPVTNESGLNYVYQGLTADGEQYVFMSWPLDGAFLPETAADATEAIASLDADRATYFSGLRDQVEAAADSELSPSLTTLGDLLRSLSIGGQVAAAQESPAAQGTVGAIGDVAGSILQWPGFTNAAGETVTVDNPEDYTLTLQPDGRFYIMADCNFGSGTYTSGDDGSLQLTPIRLTRAQCPEGSLSDEFVSFLENVSGATVEPDGAVTMNTADGGSATFVNLGPPSETDEDPLLNTVWQLTSHTHPTGEGDLFPQDPESYSVTFHPDGTYNFTADCNVGRGQFTRDGRNLTLEPGATTLVACPPGSAGDDFTDFLQRAQSYTVKPDGTLEIALDNDGLLTFSNGGPVVTGGEEPVSSESQPAAEAGGLTGVALQWPGFTDAGGNSVAVDNPEDYSLVLFPDGTFTAKADCNVANGTFTYGDDGALALQPLMQTMALCPEGSQSDAFLNFLSGVRNLTIGEDGNVTMTAADGGSATFVNLGAVEMAGSEAAQTTDPQTTDQPAPAGDPLNTVWHWTGSTATDGTTEPVDDPESYYLVLIDDGTYAFRADCNSGAGAYELDGSSLRLLPAAVTLAACPEGSRSDEFVSAFDHVTGFDFDDDGNLMLTLDDGRTLSFANGGPFTGIDTGAETETAEAADPLSGTTWQWTRFRDAKQDYTVSGNYTITFNADGSANVTADCNSANGTYSLSGADGLTVRILATTLVACPAGSLSDSFIEHLNQAGTFAVADGTLTIDLMAEGGTMTFTAAP